MKRVPIGEFSRMTHLSIKTLRHYHDVNLLAPDAIDPSTGYRYYATSQIPAAQVIRRLRVLGVPVDEVRSILAATDPEGRARIIGAHLERLERQLEQTTAAVASLRAVLDCPNVPLQIDHRTVPDTHAVAISERVRHEGILSWWRAAFIEIRDAMRALGVEREGPAGGLYHTELFSQEEGDATVFIPVRGPTRTVGRVAPIIIPAAELAVTLHAGSHELFLRATLPFHNSPGTRKTTFGSELPAFFQFLRVARCALLGLYSAGGQSQSNGRNQDQPNHFGYPLFDKEK